METLTNTLIQTRQPGSRIRMPMMITDAFIAKILTPYRDHAKYLKSAQILDYYEPDLSDEVPGEPKKPMVTIEGNFSIAESCYIDDTGHFNAVEFNICYNQLAYVLFGKCIQSGIFHRVIPDWAERVNLSYENFLKYQLSSMFIAKIEGSFLKPLNGKCFKARLSILRIMWTEETAFVSTQISFSDAYGIKSKGPVLLAFRTANGL